MKPILPRLLGAASLLLTLGAHAAPVVTPTPPKAERVPPRPAPRRLAKLEVKSTLAVPGETRTVEARLTLGANGVAGKRVSFSLESYGVSGTTDASGVVRAQLKVPALAQGPYPLVARFSGDDDIGPATDTANFGMIRGVTDLEFAGPSWNGTKGTLKITLKRKSDGERIVLETGAPKSPDLFIRINGSEPRMVTLIDGTGNLTLDGPGNFEVKAMWRGDPAYLGVEETRTYSR